MNLLLFAVAICGIGFSAAVPMPDSAYGIPSSRYLNSIVKISRPSEEKPSNIIICSASFIAKNVIITAAHCFDSLQNQRLDSLELTFSNGSPFKAVLSGPPVIHPKYSKSSIQYKSVHDLAIVTFKGNIPQAAPNSVSFCTVKKSSDTAKTYALYGFGKTEDNRYPNDLRYIEAQVVAVDTVIWAEADRGMACNGDSGGALIADNKLIGVISSHIGNRNIVTSFMQHRDFIEENAPSVNVNSNCD